MLANSVPPYGNRISVSLRPPGYQRIWPGAGWLVAFSGLPSRPMSKSPSGIHADSPLQRTWMILEWNGSRRSKAATVFGAFSVSSTPLNENGPAVTVSMAAILSERRRQQPRGGLRLGPGLGAAQQRPGDPGAQAAPHPRRELVAVLELVGA